MVAPCASHIRVAQGGQRSEVKEELAEGQRGTRTELAAPHQALRANDQTETRT